MTRFLVYVEGETEVVYVRELLKLFRCSQFATVEKAPSAQPFLMAKDAARRVWWSQQADAHPYESAWLIFDQDRHDGYDAAIELAKGIPFLHAVWSNPCIEAWFLMHFGDITKALTYEENHTFQERSLGVRTKPALRQAHNRDVARPDDAFKVLKSIWPEYKKNAPGGYLRTLFPLFKAALDPGHNSQDPTKFGSAFGEFIRYLSEVGGVSLEEAKDILCQGYAAGSIGYVHTQLGTVRGSELFQRLYEKIQGAVGFTLIPRYLVVRSRIPAVRQFLEKFPFTALQDANRAWAAMLTASVAGQLEHAPVIILNCEGTGRAKEYFEEVLFRMMEPKNVLRTKFPEEERGWKRIDKKAPDYLVLHARGKILYSNWFESLWQKKRMPLIVIVGNKLDASQFSDTALEIRFKPSRAPSPLAGEDKALAEHRDTLRQMCFHRNKGGNNTLRKYDETQKLVFWRCMCPSVLLKHLNYDIGARIRWDL
jgi:hypothetical protein